MKNYFVCVLDKIKNHENFIYWILLGILLIVVFPIYLYTDVCVTTSNGLNVWYSLLSGRLTDFYIFEYPYEVKNIILFDNGITNVGYYNFLIYIIFAIWNIPTFLFEILTGSSMFESVIALTYAKSIIIPFYIFSIYQCHLVNQFQIKIQWFSFRESHCFFSSKT